LLNSCDNDHAIYITKALQHSFNLPDNNKTKKSSFLGNELLPVATPLYMYSSRPVYSQFLVQIRNGCHAYCYCSTFFI